MKQVDVVIMGQSYVLGCPEDGEHLMLDAVAQVDREMCAIRDAGKVRARERVAVLAALNLAYRLAGQAAVPTASTPMPLSASGGAGVDLQILVARIDETLAEDGQLL